ncbi:MULTISPECIES: DUF3667 domain-containing protein [Flavobacteriaceae]|uniref:DUF3667 domain-containing protein n=1 Tax=Flavobacteriaceae TaxID=49546 RepID=UPI001491387A|nr:MULTISPECIES: DUF3667 domain-containing protein [Allomuricauda]MDC6366764.1 DUF3667 domain-containing protein [Muricauda sp. AC10]
MECKNCQASLRSDFDYCPNCGAKVIRNRLTLKNIWQDISFQVFNVDNTFVKTFRHLFTIPHLVIESYISGTRKKYMNPISYFAIGITLSGIMFFVLRNIYHINLTNSSFTDKQPTNMDFVFDYQGLLSYVIMPIYALMTWLLFIDKKKLNYTEHLATNAYITGQTSFVQVIACLLLFGFFDIRYDLFNWSFLLVIVVYQFYVLGKIHQTKFLSTFFRGLAYLLLFGIVMLGIGILVVVLALLSKQMTLEDFRAQ